MTKIALLIYVIASPTLAGILMVAALVINSSSKALLLAGIVTGFVIAVPISWLVAKQINAQTSKV